MRVCRRVMPRDRERCEGSRSTGLHSVADVTDGWSSTFTPPTHLYGVLLRHWNIFLQLHWLHSTESWQERGGGRRVIFEILWRSYFIWRLEQLNCIPVRKETVVDYFEGASYLFYTIQSSGITAGRLGRELLSTRQVAWPLHSDSLLLLVSYHSADALRSFDIFPHVVQAPSRPRHSWGG
jgi:hypothetical protein